MRKLLVALPLVIAACGGELASGNHPAPRFTSPAAIVRSFYRALNRGDMYAAYNDLALPLRPDYSSWLRSQPAGARFTIDSLAIGRYREPEAGARYTCAGIKLNERRPDGALLQLGGQYALIETPRAGWRITLQGARFRRGASGRVPSWYHCLQLSPFAPATGGTVLTFAGRANGWIAGADDAGSWLLRTQDSGRTWARHAMSVAASQLDFVDRTHGWAIGADPPGCVWSSLPRLHCRTVLLATADGGRSWRSQLSTRQEFPRLQFVDPAHGWLLLGRSRCLRCISHVLATTNGGRTWTTVFTSRFALTGLRFVDRRAGWISGWQEDSNGGCRTGVYATLNGGRSWRLQLQVAHGCSPSVDFSDRQHGWLQTQPETEYCAMGGCEVNPLYRTTDGGRQWVAQRPNVRYASAAGRSEGPEGGFQGGPVFINQRSGWIPVTGSAGPGAGGIEVTGDGGRSWIRYIPRYDINGDAALSLLSPHAGWALGCRFDGTGFQCDTLLHTVDGGRHWTGTHPSLLG